MVLAFLDDHTRSCYHHVIHSVVSSGEGDTPKKNIDFSDKRLPTPLLELSFKYPQGVEIYVYCYELFGDDQIITFPGITKY